MRRSKPNRCVVDLADPHLAQRLLEAAPIIALVLAPDGRIEYINPFGAQLTGHAPADLRGRNWFDALLPADERERVRARFNDVVAGAPPRTSVNSIVTRAGERRVIEWSSRRLEGPNAGVVGLLATGNDVTERVAAEAALREREQGFRQMFEANPHPMWVYDLETLRFLAVNDAALDHYGYRRDEFLAMTIAEIRPPEDVPALLDNLRESPAEGMDRSGFWRHRRKDGSVVAVEITSHSLAFDGHRAKLVLAHDVTERRESDRQREVLLAHLRDAHTQAVTARDLLRDVLARVDDGFVALDAQWRYTYVNERGARMLGRERPEDLVGRHIWTEYPEGVGQPFQRAYEQAMGTQLPVVLEEHFQPWDRWFENRIYPSPDGLSIYFTDITSRKRAEQAMQKSEELLRHFFDSGLVGMAITVPSKHWGQFNQRLCDMLGYSAEQMQARTWAELTHPDDLAEDLAHFDRVMAGQSDGYRMDKRFIRADGTVLSAAISVRCERDGEGRPLRFYAIVEDIGARKQAEQALARHRDDLEREVHERTAQLMTARDDAERANQAKSEFLSRMSHELRTPMNAILGFGQLMAMDAALAPKHRDFIKETLRAGRHLLALIDEVLDLARIESGRLALSPEPLAVADLLAECTRMTAPLSASRGVVIDVSGADGLVLRADRTRLRQVLLNLLSNAVKYNRAGGRVTIQAAAMPGARVRISVGDTGPGIAPERLPQLFEPFERLGAEFGNVEGTGIGLTIARQLIELMEGRIGVDGRPGEGACFWIELPRASLAEAPAGQVAVDAHNARGVAASARVTVLYVEDNPANLRLVEHIAARHAHILLVSASAAKRGLALARSVKPDLILLDIHLPDVDGFALLAQLRADEAIRPIPVVAVTAHAMPDDERRARAAGFADYITKPVDVARIDALFSQLGQAPSAS